MYKSPARKAVAFACMGTWVKGPYLSKRLDWHMDAYTKLADKGELKDISREYTDKHGECAVFMCRALGIRFGDG